MPLKPKKYTKNSKKPHKIFGFDVETYGKYNTFYMGSVYSDDGPVVFYDKEAMKAYLTSNLIYKKKHYCVATNLMFDFFALFEYDELDDFSFIFRGSELITLQKIIKHKDRIRKIKYIDTFHFATKMSLANLGKIIGLEKLPSPLFIGEKPTHEPYVTMLNDMKEYTQHEYLELYNIRDSEVTYRFTKQFEEGLIEIGAELKPTIASIAMNYFRLKYLDNRYRTPSHLECQFMFDGYYGGRTEAFKRGKIKGIFYYDINSLYPYVMTKKYPNPNSLVTISKSCEFYIHNFDGLVSIKLECPEGLKIPFLPVRTKDKLIFPTGTIKGIYTHIEIRKALELGYEIKEIYNGQYYLESEEIFSNYVNDNYENRMKLKKTGSPLEYTYKILLNSLYGKFAQRYDTKQNIYFINNFDFSEENVAQYDEVEVLKDYFVVTKQSCNEPPEFIQPIWSIHVTAYGRIELYEKFEEVDFDNVYYCDTDSLFTTKQLTEGEKLGELKLEYNIHDGIIIKPKFYEINGIVKAKGLKGFNKKENLLNLLEEGKYVTTKFTKFKESLRRIETIRVNEKILVEKKLSFEDTKRHWYNKTFSIHELQSSRPLHCVYVNNENYELL